MKKCLTAAEIRRTFFKFFQENGHYIVPSSSVIPDDQNSSLSENLFVNAGMVQHIPYLMGSKQPPWARAANSQKCIRLGGKHNDLSAIGHDNYHHTFFEMLGNWSFGNYKEDNCFSSSPRQQPYDREEACRLAWVFLTDTLRVDPRRLYVTYFDGRGGKNNDEHLEPDKKTRDIWLRIGVPADRIIGCSAVHNFWEMGATGPCGPCSEIHVDKVTGRSEKHPQNSLVNANDSSLVELWNLVFMENQRLHPNGPLADLSAPNIDCGMGFERLVSLVQEVPSAYDTDLFRPLLDTLSMLAVNHIKFPAEKARPYGARFLSHAIDETDIALQQDIGYRIVVDHIRAITIALADGVQFDKLKQGRELRRLLRRAYFHVHHDLGLPKKMIPDAFEALVNCTAKVLGDDYHELRDANDRIVAEIRVQTERFRNKIERLEKSLRKRANKSNGDISGMEAFQLLRNGLTMGWLQMQAERHCIRVDWKGLNQAIQRWHTQNGVDEWSDDEFDDENNQQRQIGTFTDIQQQK